MRADRLVSLVLLLQRHAKLTTRQLAQRLEVSERTILRDVDALSAAGIPIYADRGSHGGFRLLDGYRLDVSGFRTSELAALLLGGRESTLRDLGWGQDAASARGKLGEAAPHSQRSRVAELSERLYLDDSPWFANEQKPGCLDIIKTAVFEGRRVRVAYGPARGADMERTIAPLSLVAKAGLWYVVAQRGDALRVYRLDRVRQASLTDEPFDRPQAFQLDVFWRQWVREFESSRPRFSARLLVQSDVYQDFLQATPWLVKPDTVESERIEVVVQFEEMNSAARHILSFLPYVRAIDPPALKERVLTLARSIHGWAYGGDD